MSLEPQESKQAQGSPMSAARAMLADIKLAHSIFALPFAVLAAFMAAYPPKGDSLSKISNSQFALDLLLIIIAMVAARTAAMLSNRILDRGIDARNERTASRPLASGEAALKHYLMMLILMSALFIGVASLFWVLNANPWPLILAVPVLLWICAYGYFKRFTAFCHLWLGASLALSVPSTAIAINPVSLTGTSLWLLSGMVLCWVAGFDVIYALQDVDVDRKERLHSMPSRFGESAALWASRLLHVAAITLLTFAWWADPRFGVVFLAGVGLVGLLLLIEHLTVHRWGTTRMALTFFTLNGVLSCVLGLTGIVDVLTT